MAATYMDKHIKCPYFQQFYKKYNQIYCDGADGSKRIITQFTDIERLKAFVFERCAKHYCLCPVYRGVCEYYEEEYGTK